MQLFRTADGKTDFMGLTVVLSIAVAFVFAISFGTRRLSFSEARVPVSTRAIVFRDAPSGGIAVYDAGSQQPFAELDREKNSFMNTAIRLFIRERAVGGVSQEGPFVLTRWADGRLTLSDPNLKREAELNAFGTTNAQTFARLLPQGRPSQ